MDSEYRTTIQRFTGKDDAGKRVTVEVPYTSDPVPIDLAMDMALEMMEIASPIAGLADQAMASSAFGDTARTAIRKGGHKYALKLLTVCTVRRNKILINDMGAFNLAYDGKGGLLEATQVLMWIVEENWGDFFNELLGSLGLNSQEEEKKEKTTEEATS